MALSISQYDAISRQYSERRFRDLAVQDRRRKEAFARLPALSRIDAEIREVALSEARARLNGVSEPDSSCEEKLRGLKTEQERVLAEGGFPADYLDPVYECPDCKDTGFIGARKCHCFRKAVIDLLYQQAGIAEILREENFHTFSFDYYSDNYIDPVTGRSSLAIIRDALRTCEDFVRTFDTEFRNLFVYGSTGVGKTFLSNCIARELLSSAHSVIYMTSFRLFDILAKEKFSRGASSEALSDFIFDCDLLIIDDLGTELTNSFVASELFLCVNERIARKRSTIISTNLSLEQFAGIYSERTFSRISSNYTLLRLVGDDIRVKKKLRNQ